MQFAPETLNLANEFLIACLLQTERLNLCLLLIGSWVILILADVTIPHPFRNDTLPFQLYIIAVSKQFFFLPTPSLPFWFLSMTNLILHGTCIIPALNSVNFESGDLRSEAAFLWIIKQDVWFALAGCCIWSACVCHGQGVYLFNVAQRADEGV